MAEQELDNIEKVVLELQRNIEGTPAFRGEIYQGKRDGYERCIELINRTYGTNYESYFQQLRNTREAERPILKK